MAEEENYPTEYDPAWKDALDFAPELFLRRCAAEVIVKEIDWREDHQPLDQELRQLGVQDEEGIRRVDRLLLFKTLAGDLLYIHIEVQCYHEKDLGRRVMSYRHRLRAKYGVPVVTIVVFGDNSGRWCPKTHREGRFGSTDTCEWIPVKLLKMAKEAPDLENEDNVFSLFIAAHLAALKTSKKPQKRKEAKIRLLSNLQQRKLDRADGQEWYRLIDFLLKLPEETDREVHEAIYRQHAEEPMKYVSYAEREGIKKGREEGIEKGREEGELVGQVRLCQELLKQQLTPREELLALSQEELSALLAQLRNQVLSNGH